MNRSNKSILFLGKKNEEHVDKALNLCRSNFKDVMVYLAEWGDSLPEDIGWWDGDYIISYLSRWILPESLLKKAKTAAINFHPAPPEYPGYGPNNFALYEGVQEYGVTCHHMTPEVDAGPIIAVKRFSLFPTDTIATLLARTYDYQLVLFYDIMNLILQEKELPRADENWTRKPFTRKQLDELSQITPDMTREEIEKRIKATSFEGWKPTIELQGFLFEYKKDNGLKGGTPHT